MTAYPPPRPAGPPPAAYGAPRSGVDPKSVNPMDWGVLGATVIAFIFSFFKYYSYDAKPSAGCSTSNGDVCSIGNSAWHGFFGWFGVLLAIVGAIATATAIFAPHISLPLHARLVGVGGLGLAAVFTLLALAVTPDGSYKGARIPSDGAQVDAGNGWAYWLVLGFVLLALVFAILRLQQTGGASLSGAMSRSAPYGGGYPGAPVGPPSGYGPPPQGPPPGYGPAPQGPPPGYGPAPQGPPPGYGLPPQGPPAGYGPLPEQTRPEEPSQGYGPPPAQ